MAKLYFRYGAMSSSKSANLLMVRHNYIENGSNVLLLTSGADDRSGVGKVSSRIGLCSEAIPVYPEDSIMGIVSRLTEEYREEYPITAFDDQNLMHKLIYDAVLVDESQFLTEGQIEELASIVDSYNVPVICYGLRTDFRGKLFNGSRALMEMADSIEEIVTLCRYCKHKATHNLRTNDGEPVFDGEQIQIGDEEYLPVCRGHFYSAKEKYEFKKCNQTY